MSAQKTTNRKSKWSLESIRPKTSDLNLVPPPMLSSQVQHIETVRQSDNSHLMMKKTWEIALGPLKQIPMNLLLMYMSGNSISIFPIMMIGMMLIRTIKALFATNSVFKENETQLEQQQQQQPRPNSNRNNNVSFFQKFIYMFGNIMNILLALYKCQSMGLLPTHSSDWLAFIQTPIQAEFSTGGFIFI